MKYPKECVAETEGGHRLDGRVGSNIGATSGVIQPQVLDGDRHEIDVATDAIPMRTHGVLLATHIALAGTVPPERHGLAVVSEEEGMRSSRKLWLQSNKRRTRSVAVPVDMRNRNTWSPIRFERAAPRA